MQADTGTTPCTLLAAHWQGAPMAWQFSLRYISMERIFVDLPALVNHLAVKATLRTIANLASKLTVANELT